MKLTHAVWLLGAPLRAALVGLILAYRATAGRLASGRCRFHPTCSAYALGAIRSHGAVRGGALAGWRVLRCSPLTAGGVDPVPPGRPVGRRMTASYGPGTLEGPSRAGRTESYTGGAA